MRAKTPHALFGSASHTHGVRHTFTAGNLSMHRWYFLDYGVTIKAAPAKPNSNAQFGDSIVPEAKLVIVYKD